MKNGTDFCKEFESVLSDRYVEVCYVEVCYVMNMRYGMLFPCRMLATSSCSIKGIK